MTLGAFWRQAITAGILSLCLVLGLSTLPVQAAGNAYNINVILEITGGASFLGTAEQKSLQLEEQVINKSGGIRGRPIHFVFYDDETNPQVAVQLANRILATHPAVILGPGLVADCNAVAPLMANGPVMYCLSPGIHPPKGSFVFSTSVSTYALANAVIRYFRLKGRTRIAMMTSSDATGQDAERGLNSVLAMPDNKGMTVVARAHFNTSDVSVAAQIEKVKAAKPQAFIAWSTGAPIATVFRGIQEAALNVPVATTDGNMTHVQMKRYASFLPKQLYIPTALWVVGSQKSSLRLPPGVAAAQRELYKSFRAAGLEPDLPTTISWGPAMVVVDALRKLGPHATATRIRGFIERLKGFASVDGVYNFEKIPQRGLGLNQTVVTRWSPRANRWIVLSKPTGIPLK